MGLNFLLNGKAKGHTFLVCSDNSRIVSITNKILKLAFNTGTVKPMVLSKQVLQVRVWSRFLAHHDTPRTRTTVSWVFTGLCVRLFFPVLNLALLSIFFLFVML